eukprot:m.113286 g.113286  ORF g.113286 m.113286 type:complete len:1025 (+) comp37458_c1_seq4:1355-4429(+)
MEALQRIARSLRAARAVELPHDDDDAFSVLMPMVMQNQYRPISALLSAPNCSFNVNVKYGRARRSLAHFAAKSVTFSNCSRDLIKPLPTLRFCTNSAGAAECLALLLKKGIDSNARDTMGMTPLLLAARSGHKKCVHKLIEYGADIHIQANDGLTAVHWLACNGRTELLSELIGKGESVDVVDSQGQTALHVACQNGHKPAVILLLEKKASVDRPDNYGRTPLFFACRYGQLECVHLLVKWNAKHISDKEGVSPIGLCIEGCYHDCTLLLVDAFPQLLASLINMTQLEKIEEHKVQIALEHLCKQKDTYCYQTLPALAQVAAGAGQELLSLNSDVDHVVPLFLRSLRILCHLQWVCTFTIARSSGSRSHTKRHRRSASAELADPSNSRRGSQESNSSTGVQEASDKIFLQMESLWNVLEEWFVLLAKEVSRAEEREISTKQPDQETEERHSQPSEVAMARISSVEVASMIVNTTPAYMRHAFLRSISQSALPIDKLMGDSLQSQGRWSGNWEGQYGFSSSRHRVVRSPDNVKEEETEVEDLTSLLGHMNGSGGNDGFSDRLCAVTHGYYLHCRCEGNVRESQIGLDKFFSFAKRHEKVLKILLARNPKLIFAHFHFLLELPELLPDFIHIVRSQPFEERRKWFYENLYRGVEEEDHRSLSPVSQGNVISVSRDDLFSTSCSALANVDVSQLKRKNTVFAFEGEGGMGTGVQREFFDLLSKEILNPDYALFTQSADGATFQPNSNSDINPDHLNYFLFAGRIIGMALFHQQLLQIYFTRSLFKHILGIPVNYSDVASIDPEYANNLQWILDNEISNVDLELTFSVETDVFGAMQEVDLKPGGSSILVTDENKEEYVQLVAEMRMTRAIRPQIDSFLNGFLCFIPLSLLSLFDEYELEICLSGLPEIDLEDWRRNTEYSGGFEEDSPVIKWFWELMGTFDDKVRVQALQFATGSSRVPLGGFANLVGAGGLQKFIITRNEGASENRLPTASTCFNLLKLPEYKSKEKLRECLLIALNCGGLGFEFA